MQGKFINKKNWRGRRIYKKLTPEEWSYGQKKTKKNFNLHKNQCFSKIPNLNILTNQITDTSSKHLNKTKSIKRHVTDMLKKYINYRVRSEITSVIEDGRIKSKFLAVKEKLELLEKQLTAKNLLEKLKNVKISLLNQNCTVRCEVIGVQSNIMPDILMPDSVGNNFGKVFNDCLNSTRMNKCWSIQEKYEPFNDATGLDTKKVGKCNVLLESLEYFEKSNDTLKIPKNRSIKQKPDNLSSATCVKVRDHITYLSSHKNGKHSCSYCQKIFKSYGKLNSHLYSHTGECPFDCSNCGKAFSSKFKLMRHLLIHSKIRQFVCQICDRTFLRNDHLKNHYKVHDPHKKIYKCPKDNCKKEYSSIMSLKKHMAHHNVEDGDFQCSICSSKYETKENILYHLKSHSGSRLFKSQKDKKFKCEFCDRLFLTRKDVTRHLVVHTGNRDFLCQFCPQRFGRKDHLVRHIKKSHSYENNFGKNETEKKDICEMYKSNSVSSLNTKAAFSYPSHINLSMCSTNSDDKKTL